MFTQYCTLTFDTNYENADHYTVKEDNLQKNAPLSSISNAFKEFFQSTVMSWGAVQTNWAKRMNAKGDVAEALKHRAPIVLFPVWEWMGWVANIKVCWRTQSATIQRGSPVSQSDTSRFRQVAWPSMPLNPFPRWPALSDQLFHTRSHLLFSGGSEAPKEAEGRDSWFRTLWLYVLFIVIAALRLWNSKSLESFLDFYYCFKYNMCNVS